MHLCLRYYLKTDEFVDYVKNMMLSGTQNDIITMHSELESEIYNNVFDEFSTDNKSYIIYK